MSSQNTGVSDTTSSSSAEDQETGDHHATGGDAGGDGNGQERKPKAISWDDHQRAIRDLHKFKDKSRTLENEVQTLKSSFESLRAKALKDQEDYKTLYESEAEKAKLKDQEINKLKTSVIYNERYRAAMPALKEAGLLDSALNLLDHLDLSEIEVEGTSNGRFLTNGVDSFVKQVRERYPYAFQQKKVLGVNSGGGGHARPTDQVQWTAEKLVALERECRKKGDMQPYKAAHQEYVRQRSKG